MNTHMKSRIGVAAIMALACATALLIGHAANAQTSVSEANSESNSAVNAQQVAGASSNVTIVNPGDTNQTANITTSGTLVTSGEQTLRTVGTQTAPSMGSGHPCLLPTSVGIGIIGAGASFGTGQVDDACLLAQMGLTEAAAVMIAARNPAACRALMAAGQISAASSCGGAGSDAATETVSTSSANMAQSDNAPTGINCVRDTAGGLLRIEVQPGVDVAAARAYCQ
jgi:hypothetical protein